MKGLLLLASQPPQWEAGVAEQPWTQSQAAQGTGDAVGQNAGPTLVLGCLESYQEWGKQLGGFLANKYQDIQSR